MRRPERPESYDQGREEEKLTSKAMEVGVDEAWYRKWLLGGWEALQTDWGGRQGLKKGLRGHGTPRATSRRAVRRPPPPQNVLENTLVTRSSGQGARREMGAGLHSQLAGSVSRRIWGP